MSGSSSLPAAQALPLINQYESGNRNILTQIFAAPGQPPNTASGYYQITNSTWQQYAARVPGASQYDTAMSAPESVQTQVATALYNDQGIKPWESNVALMQALSSGQGVPSSTTGGAVPTSGGVPGAVSSFLTPVWELLTRGAVIFIGVSIVLVALIAMLIHSKTVEVPLSALKESV